MVVKKTAKNCVFNDLFQDPKYLLQLYQALHPEDKDVTEESIDIVTIRNEPFGLQYKELDFTVGGRVLVLLETQRIKKLDIINGILMSLVQIWQNNSEDTEKNVYGNRKNVLLKPEFYVIYTGNLKNGQKWLSLTEEFYGGEKVAVEIKVKILYGDTGEDIISQYVNFMKIYNEQEIKHRETKEALKETIRICKGKNILNEYLESWEKEIIDIIG